MVQLKRSIKRSPLSDSGLLRRQVVTTTRDHYGSRGTNRAACRISLSSGPGPIALRLNLPPESYDSL